MEWAPALELALALKVEELDKSDFDSDGRSYEGYGCGGAELAQVLPPHPLKGSARYVHDGSAHLHAHGRSLPHRPSGHVCVPRAKTINDLNVSLTSGGVGGGA